ncbi:hypothetical protein [Corallococcus macrosporus]|uniref:Uncharacterized protein n=1 Tax=Myxococcus fulvus (strain ATCC BAA-855 / HW-1) TaxID=483219 RepID=F8CNZ3_MYXFH|nr:hypothetical protein [Corallococcus macrosporus]AEI65372.1 hypothetical protein LILAB_17345 [Corallococcus macrosporus]
MVEGSLLNLITFGYAGRYEAAATRAEGANNALHALELKIRGQAELLARIAKRRAAGEVLVETAQFADRQVFVTRLQRRGVVDHYLYEADDGRSEKPVLSFIGTFNGDAVTLNEIACNEKRCHPDHGPLLLKHVAAFARAQGLSDIRGPPRPADWRHGHVPETFNTAHAIQPERQPLPEDLLTLRRRRRGVHAHEAAPTWPPDAFRLMKLMRNLQEQIATAVWKECRRLDIRTAREEVSPAAINAFVQHLINSQATVVGFMRGRTLVDNLQDTHPLAFRFRFNGRIEKLEFLLLAKHSAWCHMGMAHTHLSELAKEGRRAKAAPARRPIADPRPFLSSVGKPLVLVLRDGMVLHLPLLAVGPFDLLLGLPGNEVLVHLHAITFWEAA